MSPNKKVKINNIKPLDLSFFLIETAPAVQALQIQQQHETIQTKSIDQY